MAFKVQRNPDPTPAEQRAAILADPGFGRYLTDHLVRIDWTVADGWGEGAVLPYGPVSLDPATVVLHYGQEILKGSRHTASRTAPSRRSVRTPTPNGSSAPRGAW